jgi:hypothetical protein
MEETWWEITLNVEPSSSFISLPVMIALFMRQQTLGQVSSSFQNGRKFL